MRTAELFAQRSTCKRGQVGCIIVKDKRIVSVGYNGAPASLPDCYEVGCELDPIDTLASFGARMSGEDPPPSLGCLRTIHAELNAIAYAARAGISIAGATSYCTHSPCRSCAFALSAAGVTSLFFRQPYRNTPWKLLGELFYYSNHELEG